MTEAENEVDNVQLEGESKADVHHDVEGLAAKNRELLKELKKYKQKESDQELERQRKHGEWEKMYQSAEDRAKKLEQALLEERASVRNEKLNAKATQIAAELAASVASAKLLSRFVQESLNNIADEKGNLKENALEALKKEIRNNSDYAPLVAGSKASGGGASNSSASGTGKKEMPWNEYEKLNPEDKLNYSKLVHAGQAAFL